MSRKLIVDLVKQFGGMDTFIKNHVKACYLTDKVKGWNDNDALIAIFTENKSDILEFASDEAEIFEYQSVNDMISDFPVLDGYSSQCVSDALEDVGSDKYNEVAPILVFYAGEELARCYEFYLQDNPISIDTKCNLHCDAEARIQSMYG